MIERFLLDRIDTEAARSTIGGQYDLAIETASDKAEATLAFSELAETGTEIALHPPVLESVPVTGRNDVFVSDDLDIHDVTRCAGPGR